MLYIIKCGPISTHNIKKSKILNHVQWFKPSLGWSSGPTALRMACDHGHKDIYILGFDYQGTHRTDKGNS